MSHEVQTGEPSGTDTAAERLSFQQVLASKEVKE